MGVILKEKDGVWWVFINHQGKRKAKKVGTDEKTARSVADKIQARLVLNEFDMGKKKPLAPTFKTLAGLWLNLPREQKESSIERYQSGFRNHVYPSLGNKPVDQITRKDLKMFLDSLLRKGVARKTVGVIKAGMSNIFNYAVDTDVIERNPIREIRYKGLDSQKLCVEPFTEEEVRRLLSAAQAYQDGFWYPHIATAVMTGMRVGEMEALEWDDVDLAARAIVVRKSARGTRMSDTKTHKRRRVDIPIPVADALQAIKGRNTKSVFAGRDGEQMSRDTYRAAFKVILKAAGLREVRLHDLKHTYITIRLMRGHNIGDVAYQAGDTVKEMFKTYTHWIPGSFKREVDDLVCLQPDATQAQPGPALTEKPTVH